MKRVTLATLAVVCTSALVPVTAAAQQAPQYSAEAVTAAILNAYRAQDVGQLVPFFNQGNQRFAERYAEDPSALDGAFEGARAEAGVAWDGMILPARYTREPDGTFQAVIPFALQTTDAWAPLGTPGLPDFIAVVLTLDGPDDTSWGFEDVNYVSADQYGALLEAL